MNSASSFRSLAFFLAALDLAADFAAFDATIRERLEVNGEIEDFFRAEVVRVLSFFVAMRRTVTQLRVGCQTDKQLLSINHCRDQVS